MGAPLTWIIVITLLADYMDDYDDDDNDMKYDDSDRDYDHDNLNHLPPLFASLCMKTMPLSIVNSPEHHSDHHHHHHHHDYDHYTLYP